MQLSEAKLAELRQASHASFENLTERDIAALAEILKSDPPLAHLRLRWNHIGDKGAQLLADALAGNTHVSSLDLSHNEIEDEGVKALAKLVAPSKTLRTLDIAHNMYRDDGACALARAIEANSSLVQLRLGFDADFTIDYTAQHAIGKALERNKNIVDFKGVGPEFWQVSVAANRKIINDLLAKSKEPDRLATYDIVQLGERLPAMLHLAEEAAMPQEAVAALLSGIYQQAVALGVPFVLPESWEALVTFKQAPHPDLPAIERVIRDMRSHSVPMDETYRYELISTTARQAMMDVVADYINAGSGSETKTVARSFPPGLSGEKLREMVTVIAEHCVAEAEGIALDETRLKEIASKAQAALAAEIVGFRRRPPTFAAQLRPAGPLLPVLSGDCNSQVGGRGV